MATIYECDITGKQYPNEEALMEVGVYDHHGTYHAFEFGPDATIDEVRARLKDAIDSMEPFHPDWWTKNDQYKPPQIVERTVQCDRVTIAVPTVERRPLDN